MIRVFALVACGLSTLFFTVGMLVQAVGARLPASPQLTYTLDNESGSGQALWLIDLDHRLTVRLASHSFTINNVVWSPDGAHLAYHVLGDAEHQLHIYTPRTGNRRIFRGRPVFPSAPAWSPDSTQLALISDQDRGLFKLYTMDARTAELTVRPTDGAPFDRPPLWSANGERIYFYTVDAAQQRVIAQYDLRTGEESVVRGFDERMVLYTLSRDGLMLLILQNLNRLVVDDLTQPQATRQTFDLTPHILDAPLAWSPGGETLVFTSRNTGAPLLHRLTFSDGEITPLVNIPDTFSPIWSADGRYLAFLQVDTQHLNIYTSADDGSHLRLIAQLPLVNLPTLAWRIFG